LTIAAAVLAAGEGSRFDGPAHKLVTPFRGRPLVHWALVAADQAGFDQLYVVTGAVDLTSVVAEAVADRATVVPNPRWADGQATSLAAAIEAARGDGHRAIVVGLGDQPLVPATAWRSVGAAAGPIVTATFDGRRRPPVKFESSVWDAIPTEGDEGARTMLQRRPELVSELPCSGNPIDIDTMEDLRRWS
jgi:CTP:molybdopterin cytidylyltransferase MocA